MSQKQNTTIFPAIIRVPLAHTLGAVVAGLFMGGKMKIRLVVYLKDGRELSGSYPYLEAISRLAWARELPEYQGFELEDAI